MNEYQKNIRTVLREVRRSGRHGIRPVDLRDRTGIQQQRPYLHALRQFDFVGSLRQGVFIGLAPWPDEERRLDQCADIAGWLIRGQALETARVERARRKKRRRLINKARALEGV